MSLLGLSACSNKAKPHTHTFSDEWSYDETTHWHAATCQHADLRADEAPHTLVMNADETVEECFCGYVHVLVSELAAPTNLAFAEGVLTFNAVEHAKRYEVTVKQDSVVVDTTTITTTSIPLYELPLGNYDVSVVAKAGDLSSAPANLSIVQKFFKDESTILEAEDYVSNDAHISVDEKAHGGKYALGFNDCGQGLYFQYYAFAAGTRDVDIYYATGAAGSYMTLFVGTDEEHGVPAYFNENTGWFGDNGGVTAKVTVQATLAQGWNDIYLFKNGTGSDSPEYGGWAQIDYIEIKGTGEVYDATEYAGLAPTRYRFEAEQAKWHWTNQYMRPNMSDAFPSHGYLGEQNELNDGVTFDVNIQKAGTYKLKFASGANGDRYYDVTINGVKENRKVTTGGSWNVVGEDAGFLAHLNQGKNHIDFSRGANGDWACIDYLAVEFVSEEDPVLPTEITGLSFENNVLLWNAPEGATEYKVVLEKDDEELISAVVAEPRYEVPAAIHGSNINATVYAKKGFFVANAGSSLLINPGTVMDNDVKLEAEKATIGARHYSVDANASGGGYALGFDNCGEGMYFRYYSYAAGTRKVTVAYATDAPGSKMEFIVNNGTPVVVTFNTRTGWFGDNHALALVDVNITLAKGWNNIYLIKNGTDTDDPAYGGWAQIDYIKIEGTHELYDAAELTDLVCSSYKLEAEFGNYVMSSGAPDMSMGNVYSIAYLGNQNTEGDGVTYKFYVDQEGTYKVQFCCGGDGSGATKVGMKVNSNAITDDGQTYYTLSHGAGWNVAGLDGGFNVQLNEGWNTIQLSRLSDAAGGRWICIDYCLVTMVA